MQGKSYPASNMDVNSMPVLLNTIQYSGKDCSTNDSGTNLSLQYRLQSSNGFWWLAAATVTPTLLENAMHPEGGHGHHVSQTCFGLLMACYAMRSSTDTQMRSGAMDDVKDS